MAGVSPGTEGFSAARLTATLVFLPPPACPFRAHHPLPGVTGPNWTPSGQPSDWGCQWWSQSSLAPEPGKHGR